MTVTKIVTVKNVTLCKNVTREKCDDVPNRICSVSQYPAKKVVKEEFCEVFVKPGKKYDKFCINGRILGRLSYHLVNHYVFFWLHTFFFEIIGLEVRCSHIGGYKLFTKKSYLIAYSIVLVKTFSPRKWQQR
jgi:hypothetical protein